MKTTAFLASVAGLAVCAPALAQVDLFNNGNLSTGNLTTSGVAAPGAGNNWSECPGENVPPGPARTVNTIAGFGHAVSAAIRVADDFTIPSGQTWNISAFRFVAYQTGMTSSTNTHNAINFRVWNGSPADPTSTVVFGDTTTNRFSSGSFVNLFRVFNTGANCGNAAGTAPGTTRPLWLNEATAGFTLGAGTYWVDWQTGGSLASGPWVPPITIDLNTRGKPGANGLQFITGWLPVADVSFGGTTTCATTAIPQDFGFVVRGTQAGPPPCYANCDQSTVAPVLNVGDFVCFNTAFQAAQSLPAAQQVTAYANCDQSTVAPVLNVGDFVCFNTAFQAGCP